ncbi:hypothetical protein BDR26DRAFT_855519 [Obelidium mucronatum]|nr:hypothetical protein BDR26DRAFT_855519 [Obelidium mucronatum]
MDLLSPAAQQSDFYHPQTPVTQEQTPWNQTPASTNHNPDGNNFPLLNFSGISALDMSFLNDFKILESQLMRTNLFQQDPFQQLAFRGPPSPMHLQSPYTPTNITTPVDNLPISPATTLMSATTTSTNNNNNNYNKRFRATPQELDYLMTHFEQNPFPDASTRTEISETLHISEKQVLVWFQNRRATLKSNGIVAVKPKRLDIRVGGAGIGSLSFKKAWRRRRDQGSRRLGRVVGTGQGIHC